MSWRCRNRSDDGLACMLRPGHPLDHQAVALVRGHVALIWWKNDRGDVVFDAEGQVVHSGESGVGIARDAGPTPSSAELAPEPTFELVEYPPRDRNHGRDIVGRHQTRETSRNLYAGTGDGIHTNWNMYGHEILPLPTLDELEAA